MFDCYFDSGLRSLFKKLHEEDKVKHFAVSFWLTVVANFQFSLVIAFFSVLFIGLLKEVWDHFYGSGFCFYDIFANCLGIVVAFVPVLIFKEVFLVL